MHSMYHCQTEESFGYQISVINSVMSPQCSMISLKCKHGPKFESLKNVIWMRQTVLLTQSQILCRMKTFCKD